jgi:uncharacterized protein
MPFAIPAVDRPGALELRVPVRPTNLDCLAGEAAQIKVGGPLPDEDDQPSGSLPIVEANASRRPRRSTGRDPHRSEGVFERVEIRRRRAALGSWIT